MSTDLLLMAVLAAMTCVALMIAVNSRGRWRATLSSLMAVCMLGGTIWVFTLQYNLMDSFEAPADRAERRRTAEQTAAQSAAEQTRSKQDASSMSSMIADAAQFADALSKERMFDPLLSHAQLVARADAVEQRYEALKRESDLSTQLFERFPAAAKPFGEAMADLKAACHFYRAYYYAENTDAEISTERLMKQRAKNAHDTLTKAAKEIKTPE